LSAKLQVALKISANPESIPHLIKSATTKFKQTVIHVAASIKKKKQRKEVHEESEDMSSAIPVKLSKMERPPKKQKIIDVEKEQEVAAIKEHLDNAEEQIEEHQEEEEHEEEQNEEVQDSDNEEEPELYEETDDEDYGEGGPK